VKFKTKGLKEKVDEHRDQIQKDERSSEHKNDVRGRVGIMCHDGPGLGSRGDEEVPQQERLQLARKTATGLVFKIYCTLFIVKIVTNTML
jgi:hypothetical protein